VDLGKAVQRAIRIVQLDRAAISEVAGDEAATIEGVIIVAIAGLAAGIGGARQHVAGIVAVPIAAIIGSFIGAGVLYLVGLLVRPPNWDFMQLYRALAHASIVSWVDFVRIVPVVGGLVAMLAAIYHIVVTVVCVQTVGRCDLGKAIIIVVIPVVVCCGLAAVAFFTVGAAIMGMIGLASHGS
jgi:hypothetical protein